MLLSVGFGVVTPPRASAVYATGGAGLYQGSIDWFTWGAEGTSVGNGTYTNDSTVGGVTLRVTCTVSNRTFDKAGGTLTAYRSGWWDGDSFDNLYNIGGTDYLIDPVTDEWGSHNTMVAGLMAGPTALGVTANFDFSCSATLGGVAVPLQGLVMADAEASNSILTQEWLEATPVGTTTWRLIDSFSPTVDETSDGCDTTAYARRTGSTVRMYPDKDECFATPSGVMFMDGATAAHVTLKGGGQTAVALGVVISTDFGDAPASYGQAGSLFQPTWTGGTLADNTNNPIAKGPIANTTTIARATQVPPTATLLGARIDAEPAYQASSNASGDDANGVDDEDAISAPGTVLTVAGKTYTVPNVACTGPGYVSGWIDWNGNGVFDAGERSGVVQCTGSSVALSWTVPTDVKTSSSFMRLRIAGTSAAAGVATGMTTIGEVEDYPIGIRVAVPGIQVVKSASVTTVVGSGPVTYTYKVTNTGTEPLKTVALTDDKCTSPAFVSGDVNSDSVLDLTETWTYSCTQTLSYPADAPSVTNTATATGTGTVSDKPAIDTDVVTVTVTASPAVINATKSGVDVQVAQPFDGTFVATYTVSVTNSGQAVGSYGALTDTPAFSSALSVVGASWTTTGPGVPAGGSATGAGPYTFAPAATSLAGGATHTYTVKVTFKYAGTAVANVCDGTAGHGLFNSVSLPSGQETNTSDNSACLPPPPVNQGVTVEKTSVPADGASVAPGSTVVYTISFTSTGSTGSYLDYVDHLVKVLDDAFLDTGSFVSSSGQVSGAYDSANQSIRIGGYLPAGQTVTFSYTVTVDQIDDLGDADLLNVVVPHGTTPSTTCTVGDPLCTEHPVSTPSLLLKKNIVARNTAADQFTLTIERTDGASPVTVGSATTSGSSTGVQVATATEPRAVPGVGYRISEAGAGGTSLAGYAISVTCVTDAGTAVATAPVSGQANAWDLSYPTAVGTTEVTCQITNGPTRSIYVDKLGSNCDVGQPTCALPGAQFALYDTDPSVAGAVPLTGGITADPSGSSFTSAGLADGVYWLVETKAPTGFSLMASPIRFSLSSTGVALAESSTVVVVDPSNPFRIQVMDATAAPLPMAGGEGWIPFLGLGFAMILGAIALSLKGGAREEPGRRLRLAADLVGPSALRSMGQQDGIAVVHLPPRRASL